MSTTVRTENRTHTSLTNGGVHAFSYFVVEKENTIFYELKDHLGNVNAVVSDELQIALVGKKKKIKIKSLSPIVLSSSNYYPFGMQMPGRYSSANTVANGGYRFGFNGKEKDDEVSGSGNQYDYGFRIYNPRIAKFLSVDPLTKQYAWYTPYQFAGNKPIIATDIDGLEENIVIYGTNCYGGVDLEHNINWNNTDPLRAPYGPLGKGTLTIINYNHPEKNGKRYDNTDYIFTRLDAENKLEVWFYTESKWERCPNAGTMEKILYWEGGSDPALNGRTYSKQDWVVAISVLGVMSGGVLSAEAIAASIAAPSAQAIWTSVLTTLGTLNNIDDLGTNSKGNSISQQIFTSKTGQVFSMIVKTSISAANLTVALKSISVVAKNTEKSINAATDAGSLIITATGLSSSKNEKEGEKAATLKKKMRYE